MNALAKYINVQPNLLWAISVILCSLLAGTVVRVIWIAALPTDHDRDRLASLKTWWSLVLLFCGAVLSGRAAVGVLFAVVSFLGLREFRRLTNRDTGTNVSGYWVYVLIPLQFLWVVLGWFEPFWVTVPVASLLTIAGTAAASGQTKGFVRQVTFTTWGVMMTVFCVSHAAMLLSLPESSNQVAGNAGWIVYLVLLTESNDISQALWGRQFGRHKVTPHVSPHKTWEGLLLGICTTVILAVGLAPLLTSLHDGPIRNVNPAVRDIPILWSALAGFLIAIGGFFGDITMSALKRDVGVKDSSTLLPGQGGILDRIDSLIFTAPVFFYYVYWLFA